jgi:hypothetical protein
MSKVGVGVGEDFPVDDGNGGAQGGGQGPRDERAEFEEWKRRRDAWRSEREAARAERDAWRARKRAFKQKIRDAARESFGDGANWRDGYGRHGESYYHWRPRFSALWMLVPVVGLLLFFSLVAAIFKAPFAFLALILIGAFLFAHQGRGHFRHHHGFGRDYGRDYNMARGPIVTPPPAKPEPPAAPPAVTDGK